MDPSELRKTCRAFGQEHLLQFEASLAPKKAADLHRDVSGLDLAEWKESFNLTVRGAEKSSGTGSVDERMRPIEAECCYSVVSSSKAELDELFNVTLGAIAKGKGSFHDFYCEGVIRYARNKTVKGGLWFLGNLTITI